MLYEILYPLKEYFFIFNVFQYLTFRAAGAVITSLLISFFLGPKIIRTLNNRQIGEKIYNGPESHQKKEGTPTMGGIIILLTPSPSAKTRPKTFGDIWKILTRLHPHGAGKGGPKGI